MSSRYYDFILELNNISGTFETGNGILGLTSYSFGEIVDVNGSNLKVKVANNRHYYEIGESVQSNTVTINAFATSLTFTSTPISVGGVDYAIDGLTNTFPLPISVDYKDEIKVYANNILVPQEAYEWPSTNNSLTVNAIDFNNYEILTVSGSNNEVFFTQENVFPPTSLSNLKIVISRGITDYPYYIGSETPASDITATAQIQDIRPSNYIRLKNSFEQEPLVRLYTIYYPGEWYPPNANNNPGLKGSGYPWPRPFPLRYAEVFGEDLNIPDYSIEHEGFEYLAKPLGKSSISISTDGSIGELTLSIDNVDYFFSDLVDNPSLVGYNNSSAVTATVNGELVTNIDPRTDPTHASFDANVVISRGGYNVAFDYSSTTSLGEEWVSLYKDSRDLIGAVVEIKSMYASTLQYWPEYSLVSNVYNNVVTLYNTFPYRVGDIVQSNTGVSVGTITSISNNQIIVSTNPSNSIIDNRLYIVNSNYDPYSYTDYKLFITKMESYDSAKIDFTLSDRTTDLIGSLPRRRFYKNTCPWKYQSLECKYPLYGTGNIANTFPITSANGMFTVNNVTTTNPAADICSKSIVACKLRNNTQNFGGFPATNDKI